MKVSNKKWLALKAGDIVDIVAPSKIGTKEELEKAKQFITKLGLIPRIYDGLITTSSDLESQDPFSVNNDEQRFESLKQAFYAPDSKLIWAIRGGYGCSRIVEKLEALPAPEQTKLLIGFSDITVLHIFLQQKWGWSSLHANCLFQYSQDNTDEKLVDEIKKIIFGKTNQIVFTDMETLNIQDKQAIIESEIVGGNLCLVETSIGTSWQIDAADKILLLEDVNEQGYRVDRSLEHLKQAKILKNAKAVIFGSFTNANDKDGKDLVSYALKKFADSVEIPVMVTKEVGHIPLNRPIALGTHCVLTIKDKASLVCDTGVINSYECHLSGEDSCIYRDGLEDLC